MIKIFKKDAVWFAVMWIAIYVVGFSVADKLSEAIGVPKLLTVVIGALLSIALLIFAGRNKLWNYLGLCGFRGEHKAFLYHLPMLLISCVNFVCGLTLHSSVLTAVFSVLAMCFVAFLEEVIFRGLLFRGMCEDSVKTAFIVSSLTFGMGHIVNLLNGAPLFDTLLQLVYASAIGFCFTAVFYKGGSILPCIAVHGIVNISSIFAREPSAKGKLLIAIAQCVLSVGYGVWLLKVHPAPDTEPSRD